MLHCNLHVNKVAEALAHLLVNVIGHTLEGCDKGTVETLNFIQMYKVTCEGRSREPGRHNKAVLHTHRGWVVDIMYSWKRLALIMADTEEWRRLNQPRLEQVVICGSITSERSFCPLIEKR